jgi:cell wall-associated NlpC family hydrolase
MIDRVPRPFRRSRKLVAVLTGAGFAFVLPAMPVLAAQVSGHQATGDQRAAQLQVDAQELAGQIQAEGRTLDQLDSEYLSALNRYQQLQASERSMRSTLAATTLLVRSAKVELQNQAILAYVTGGGPIVTFSPGRAGLDPSLTVSYAEIIAGGQKRALDNYRNVLAAQTRESRQLTAAAAQARLVVATLRADQNAAESTLSERQQTLAQIKGRIAVLVAADEAAQSRAEEAAVKARLSQEGQQLPGQGQGSGASPGGGHSRAPSGSTISSARPLATAAPTSAPASRSVAPTTRPAPPITQRATTTRVTTTRPTVPATTPTTSPPDPPTTTPPIGDNVPAPGASAAIAYAVAQLGKPYGWGGTGPKYFDCSGLVMKAWDHAGVYLPRVAQEQYNATRRIPLSDLLPGDLVFFGTPSNVYHVGLYVGNGTMIDAPETGLDVSYSSIYWVGLLGGGRV